MDKNEIDIYLHTILKKQLQKLKVSNHGLYAIINNVKKQLYSIIKHWNDTDFINAIFCTVIEEGHFYEPYVNDKIGNLVVLGIRNSLIEVLASVDYKEYGLKAPLSDNDIKAITSQAIIYFKDVDIDSLSNKLDLDDDYYYDLAKKYNVAYNSLVQLGKCSSDNLQIEYPKLTSEPYILEELVSNEGTDKKINNGVVRDIASGINDTLAPGLIELLRGILNKKASIIYIDSFKYLSRNFEVNLKVLQFLLTHNATLLTSNFYIQNDYVSRRKDLIRAGHGNDFNEEAIKTIGEVSLKYKHELEKTFPLE